MENILEKLYRGELYPYSNYETIIKDFKENREKAFHSYTAFLAKLPEEFKDEFVKLIDNHLNLLPYELEQNFIDGFCIGTHLMTEVHFNLQSKHNNF